MANDASREPSERIREVMFKGVDLSEIVSGVTRRTDNMSAFIFGDVWGGPNLDLRDRSLVTLGILIALGRVHELAIHFQIARNIGLSREELGDVCLQAAPYAGMPASVDAQRVLARTPDPS
jgi:4-carboxymuconolactone decarboxylase